MKCEARFTLFGSGSKGHCRYCGRVFCKSCTVTCAIPEYGYPSKVKICKPCFAFRNKARGENEAEAAAAAADDDEDATTTAAASSTGAAGAVLSYDSDELE